MGGIGGPEITFLAIRRTSRNKGRGADGIGQEDRDARDILNERYARGEIDREDYLGMRRDIED